MPHTLVTGANSFVAAHIINELIKENHTVTGTVRRTSAGEALLTEHPEWKGKLDFAVVEDYANDGAFDDIFQLAKDYDHIIHVAAPLFAADAIDYDRDYLRPGVGGNIALLKGAKAHAPTLKSIVVTGSINSITDGSPSSNSEREYTNESWNPITQETARNGSAYEKYQSSKKEAELALWDFVKKENPQFTTTVFLPSLIFGPPIQPLSSISNLNFSVNVVYTFFSGTYTEIPQTHAAGMFPSYIDVRDLAIAHVRALTNPKVANKRLLIGGQPLTSSLIVKTLEGLMEKGELEGLRGRLPKDTGKDVGVVFPTIAAEEGNLALGLEFRSAEETFGDLVRRVLELEKREKEEKSVHG